MKPAAYEMTKDRGATTDVNGCDGFSVMLSLSKHDDSRNVTLRQAQCDTALRALQAVS